MEFGFGERCPHCGEVRSPDGWCQGCLTPRLAAHADRARARPRYTVHHETRRDRGWERVAWTILVVGIIPALLSLLGPFAFFSIVFYGVFLMPWALRDIWRRQSRIRVEYRPSRESRGSTST